MARARKPRVHRHPHEHPTIAWHVEWLCCNPGAATFFGRSFAGAHGIARDHANAHAAIRAARIDPGPGGRS